MADADLTVAILAGGASQRLGGHDKGLQMLGGRALIGQVIDVLVTSGMARRDGIIIVANRNIKTYAKHANTICDAEPGLPGPLAGVAAALNACVTPWLLTVPVDCPDPPADLASRLIEHAAARNDVRAFVAHDGERRQPLFALYRKALASSAAAAVAAGAGVWRWQNEVGAIEVDFADRQQQFCNLNTPEEFAAHAAEHRLDR